MKIPSLTQAMVSFVVKDIVLFIVIVAFLSATIAEGLLDRQESDTAAKSPAQQTHDQQAQGNDQQPEAQQSEAAQAQDSESSAGPVMFQSPMPADQLAFLKQFDGKPAKNLMRDKEFRRLLHNIIPNCMFHYGHDMPLTEAMDTVIKGSSEPVTIRDGRYLLVSGHMGPYLIGRGFIWIDLQDGVGLGGFYFHPTNGEPTPAVNIFSRQITDEPLKLSQLPATFAEDLAQWSRAEKIPAVTTRYFITGSNRKILLEHDEDYCAANASSADRCQQMNADAADLDLTAAYYLEQTNNTTNATAWMITGEDQIAWVRVRDNTCRVGSDPLLCRIHFTRERVRFVIRRRPGVHVPVRTTRR